MDKLLFPHPLPPKALLGPGRAKETTQFLLEISSCARKPREMVAAPCLEVFKARLAAAWSTLWME